MLALALVLAAPSGLPDLVALIGVPGERDGLTIQRDCQAYAEFWKRKGLDARYLVQDTLRNTYESVLALRALHERMSLRPTGRLTIFVSGHGSILKMAGKGCPALSFQSVPTRLESYPWKDFFVDLDAPQGWKVLLVADT